MSSEFGHFWKRWIGRAGGAASLGADGFVPSSQLVTRWTKYTVMYSSLSAAGLTNDIELFSLAAGSVIHAVTIKHSAAFTGGLISAYTLSVGVSGNLTKYATALSVFGSPAATAFGTNSVFGMESAGAATSIRVAAVSVTGLLNAASQGSADIWVMTSALP